MDADLLRHQLAAVTLQIHQMDQGKVRSQLTGWDQYMLSTVPTASEHGVPPDHRSRHAPMRVVTVGFMECPCPRRGRRPFPSGRRPTGTG